jgi:KinB signaling pathway activation protein
MIIILVTGLLRYLVDPNFVYQFEVDHFGYFLIFLILFGMICGTLSHIMFFCFLVINLLGKGILQNRFIWQGTQIIVVISLIVINHAYLQKMYISAFTILISAALVAYYKSKLTNSSAFIPTFFFMNIGTLFALIPVWNNKPGLLFILPAVLVCNAWQIMQLHQIVGQSADKQVQSN